MERKKSPLAGAAMVLLMAASSINAHAQDWKAEKRVNVLFGLSQVVAHGFNIEGNYISKRLIIDYSHGVSLDFQGSTVTPNLRRQGVAVKMPWTTGFGIGYRLTEWINIRVEPKMHRFEFFYANEDQSKGNEITSYTTFSLGLGVYGCYRPFKKRDSFLSGLMISPSLRFWPTVGSTLKDNKFMYFNKQTSSSEEIKTLNPGVGFTPIIVNISVGYSFKIKKRG